MSHKNTFMFAIAMLPAVLLPAQNERQPQQAPATNSKGTNQNDMKGVAAQNDAILATMLHVGSTNEVTLAQVALKQAQSPEVRAFAQKMIDDHNAWSAKLQPLTTASGMGVGAEGSNDRNKADRNEKTDPSRGEKTDPNSNQKNPLDASAPRTAPMGGAFDHTALIRDLGKKCVQSDTKMLSSKTGAEFDRCFMAMQVASHVHCADMLEVFKSYASPNLAPTLEAGQKTIAAHLDHAKTLCKQLEESGTTGNGSGNGSGDKNPRDGR